MKTQLIRLLIALLVGTPVFMPVLASAQSGGVNAGVQAQVQTSGTAGTGSVGVSATVTAKMTRGKTKADTEIDRRIQALNKLLTRAQEMTKVSADFKQSVAVAIQNQITGLGALKTKIEADTDESTLKTDVQSVTAAYRIFVLVLPQVNIAAAADRQATIVNMLSDIGVKLQARLQTAQAAGADVTALAAALTDMAAKLADAQTHAQAAIDGTATLTPDEGDKTKMQTNLEALKKARTDLQTAQQDLVAARKDVTTILQGLKKLSVTSTTSASSSVQTQ